MKRITLFFVLFVIISLLSISNSYSEVMYNINYPEVKDESKEASEKLSQVFSLLFDAIESLEQSDFTVARAKWMTMLELMHKAYDYIMIIEEKVSPGSINIDSIPSPQRKMIEDNFEKFELEIPKDKTSLVKLTSHVVFEFLKYLSSIEFGDNFHRTRLVFDQIFDKMWRFMKLGISVSEIAASDKNVIS